jgi:hypothetical protein
MALGTSAALGLALIAPAAAHAQAFKAGTNYIGPSISLSSYGSTAQFNGSFEHAINNKWGWGIQVGYFSYSAGDAFYNYSYKYIPVAGTVAYHFVVTSNEKLDPFVGGAIGYYFTSCSISNVNGNVNGVDCGSLHTLLIGGFGGIRYWVNDKLALVGRIGAGVGYLTVGVDFKM